jgi:hypothetical protein
VPSIPPATRAAPRPCAWSPAESVGPFGHLAVERPDLDHFRVWRRPKPVLDSDTLDGIIRMLMEINAKLDLLLGEEGDDGWEDES